MFDWSLDWEYDLWWLNVGSVSWVSKLLSLISVSLLVDRFAREGRASLLVLFESNLVEEDESLLFEEDLIVTSFLLEVLDLLLVLVTLRADEVELGLELELPIFLNKCFIQEVGSRYAKILFYMFCNLAIYAFSRMSDEIASNFYRITNNKEENML